MFTKGKKFKVTKPGCALHGMKPIAGGRGFTVLQGWSQTLNVGDVLTCDGRSWTSGDGVPVTKWRGPNGEWLAQDCEFTPSIGASMWNMQPDLSCLEPVE